MSSGSTSNYSLQYPLSTDPVNVASDIEDLAKGIDTFLTNPALINNININGGGIVTSALTGNIFNTNATTLNIGGVATNVNIGSASGKANFAGDVNVATGKSYKINNVNIFESPVLTGTPISTTPPELDNSTKIATTAYVVAAVAEGGSGTIVYQDDVPTVDLQNGTLWVDKNGEAEMLNANDYYTSVEVDTILSTDYYTNTETDTILSTDYYTKAQLDEILSGAGVNPFFLMGA